ncbi:MAG: hypothetical protein AAFV53_09435 [Myxococcota bacterium]
MMVPLLLLGLLSCEQPDPLIPVAAAYTRDVRPLLVENEAIEQQFQTLAGEMASEAVRPQQLASALSDEILPASMALLSRTDALDPQAPPLDGLHDDLRQAWHRRHDAWAGMLDAWKNKDVDAFASALKDRDAAEKLEETTIINLDAALRPYGYRLRRYPD